MIVSRAPLRISLAGGGTDLEPYVNQYGGCVLSYTINYYAFCKIEPSISMWEDKWQFRASDLNQTVEFTDIDIDSPYQGDCAISVNAYLYFLKNFDVPVSPISITTRCDAMPGSGLGGSSALTVAVVSALAKYHNVPLSDYDVAAVAYDIERVMCKLPGGKQDQFASAFGGCNFIEFKGTDVIVNPLRLSHSLRNKLEMNFILFYTGNCRNEHVIEDNMRRLEENSESVELTHKIKENCFAFKDALLTGNFYQMDTLLEENWQLKKDLSSSITTDKIEEMYQFGIKHGMKAGKLCGAGGGGHILFSCDQFADMSNWLQNIAQLQERYPKARIIPWGCVNNGVETWSQ
jgi:D-glycero-alpha-D-manno-heptose-7-phosphate kinase